MTSLWRHQDFLKLWAGQTVSQFGSLVGQIALLLVAAITLDASPLEVSVLRVAQHVPALLLGLYAGVWVDRLRRRPILIWSDAWRALLLASIPLAASLGLLRVEQLWLVALLVGGLGTLFEVAYRSYLPSLVAKEQLLEGNAKLQATSSIAEVAGFGVAGALVQTLTAPVTLLVDAGSFVVSAVSVALIRRREPPPTAAADADDAWREIRIGLRYVLGDPVLRALAGARATGDFFVGGVWASVLVLFILRELGVEPWLMTAIFAIGGVSSFVGALFVERVVARFGIGRSLIGATLVYRLTPFFVPLAAGPFWLVVVWLTANQCSDAAWLVHDVGETSLVQSAVPDRLLGRVNACFRVLSQAAILGGTLVGGVLAEVVGLRATMLLGATGGLSAVVWLVFSPLRAAAPGSSG